MVAGVEAAKEAAFGLDGAPRRSMLDHGEQGGDGVAFSNVHGQRALGGSGHEPVDR